MQCSYAKNPDTAMGTYKDPFRWISNLLGGSRTDKQVEHFVRKELLGKRGEFAKLLQATNPVPA